MEALTLYGKASSGKLKIWEVSTSGENVIIRHGYVGGKITEKVTQSVGKNIGKANETTPEQQAVLEAKAKWQHQLDRGYFKTKEEALGSEKLSPMKAKNYKEDKEKVTYPCFVQPKLNGVRIKIFKDGEDFKAASKSGLETPILKHWVPALRILDVYGFLEHGLDGEIYAGLESQGGLSLQRINAARVKENEDTPKLEFYVYDVCEKGMPFHLRVQTLESLFDKLRSLAYEDTKLPINVVDTAIIDDEAAGDAIYDVLLDAGFEGMVYRNTDGMYEYGKRSNSLIKRKPRETAEASVISSTKDKNGEGVLTVKLQNGVVFELKMRKDSSILKNYREYYNSVELIGQFIQFEYEELSDSGVPTKPAGIGIRDVDSVSWEPKE